MKRRKMIGSLVTLCFASLVLASCALESSPQATTQSELGEAESEELGSDAEREWIESLGDVGTQDCIGDCSAIRNKRLNTCNKFPSPDREHCKDAAWKAWDKCVQVCL